MAWPAASFRPLMAIEMPVAGPLTTTWKDSNSFFAPESFAEEAAPAGGCIAGRIFCTAGATQTCAADAEPATARATATAAALANDFKMRLLGGLLAGTARVLRSGLPTEGACRFF